MLPIDRRSLRPGPIDGHRQLGRRVMKCPLLSGGEPGPGFELTFRSLLCFICQEKEKETLSKYKFVGIHIIYIP